MPTEFKFEPIPIDSIEISEANVRKSDIEEGLDELAQSISEIGLQQPIVVYRKGNKHHLIIGQRRFLACKKLRMEKMPAIIRSVKDETYAKIISFSENIHRLDLNYRDKMRVAVELMNRLKSVNTVAKALGVNPQTVRNYLGYEGVPEKIKKMVEQKKLGARTAVAIVRSISDEDKAVKIADKVIEQPSSDRRKLVLDTAKENPTKKVSEITKLVKKTKFKKITLHLTPRMAGGLEAACRDYQGEPEYIATEALEEWLSQKGFLK